MPIPEDRTTDSDEGAADQPSLARPVEEIRADLARAASPYYCGGGPVADRLATDAASLLSRLAAVEREAAEAKAERDWLREVYDADPSLRVAANAVAAVRRMEAAEARIEAVEHMRRTVPVVSSTEHPSKERIDDEIRVDRLHGSAGCNPALNVDDLGQFYECGCGWRSDDGTPMSRARAEVVRLSAELDRVTGIQRNGEWPKYLEARARMFTAEAENAELRAKIEHVLDLNSKGSTYIHASVVHLLLAALGGGFSGNQEPAAARVGDTVTATLRGKLIDYDTETGKWTLETDGVDHVPWRFELHWAQPFTVAHCPSAGSSEQASK